MSKREFELDLTSVCVGSGVVQLPLKMQTIFVGGTIPARVDGEDVLLTFVEPRRLSGFKEHFERRGLRGNDKLRFEVDVTAEKVVSLSAASIKRERKQPAQKEPAAAASNAGAGGSGTEHSQAQPTTPSWGDSHDGGQVRAVRRVRVEGGMPLPVSPAVQRFSTQPHAAGGGASDTGNGRNGAPASSVWAPLDGLSADSESYAPVQNDYPESTVREVRRSKVVDDRRQVWQDADLQVDVATAGASQTAPPLYSYGFEVADDVPAGYEESTVTEGSERLTGAAVATGDAAPVPLSDPLQPVAEAGASQRTPVSAYVSAPRIPVPRNTVAGSTWQPTPASGLNPAESSEATRQPRLIEETDLAPRLDGAYQPPRQVEPQREESPRYSAMQERPRQESTASVQVAASRAIDDAEFGGEYLPSGRGLEAVLQGKEASRAARAAGVGRNGDGAQPVAAEREVADVPVPRHGPVPAQQQLQPVRMEDDLRMIQAYLERPNVPAIVRSEVIAAELGIDDQRSERALERLSENRDKVSRIRKGAYMVKRSALGHSTSL